MGFTEKDSAGSPTSSPWSQACTSSPSRRTPPLCLESLPSLLPRLLVWVTLSSYESKFAPPKPKIIEAAVVAPPPALEEAAPAPAPEAVTTQAAVEEPAAL